MIADHVGLEIKGYNSWDIGGTLSIICVIGFSVVAVAVLFGNIGNIVECLVFPEKVVFDFITGYIESMKEIMSRPYR